MIYPMTIIVKTAIVTNTQKLILPFKKRIPIQLHEARKIEIKRM